MQMVPQGVYPQPGMQVMGQPGPGIQMMGQPNLGMQMMGQPGLGMQMTPQPGLGMQMMGQPNPGMQMMGQPGLGMQMMGQPGPGIQMTPQPGLGMQMTGQPGLGMQITGQPGPGMQMTGQPGPGMQMTGQPGPGMQMTGQPGPGMQTTPGTWIPVPERPTGCPPGLEYLCNVDNLIVEQEIDETEISSGYEQNNKYTVKNGIGQKAYYAVEDTPFCARMFYCESRPFDMKIMDNLATEVIHLRRDLACSCCCFPCCLQKLQVCSPPGVPIGTVEQCWSITRPSFVVKNENGIYKLRIKGPCCFLSCGDIDFEVLNEQGTKVGSISRKWDGPGSEMVTNADNFNISFPISLDVKVKALLLGALFLIVRILQTESANPHLYPVAAMEKSAIQESDIILHNVGYPNAPAEQPGMQMMPTPGDNTNLSYARVPVNNPDQIPASNPTPYPVTYPSLDNQAKSDINIRENYNYTAIQQQPTKQNEAENDSWKNNAQQPQNYPTGQMPQQPYNYQQPGMQMVPQGAYPQPGMQMMGPPGPGMQMMGQPGPGMQMMGQPGPGMQMVGPGGMPIMTPPGPVMQMMPSTWIPVPERPPGCPPGLEYLCNVDRLLVHQEIEMLELFSGFEENNKYTVKNGIGQKVYYAVEDTPFCTRMCCGNSRPFDMKIMDNFMTEVIHIRRDLACSSCCFPCCLQTVRVFSPPGVSIGTVEQCWSICKPSFVVKDEVGKTVLRIRGPFCLCSCGDVVFKVLTESEDIKVGNISKQWSGFTQEMVTDADNFNISFPIDLDVKVKALLLGALFLIDFMYFENKAQKA